MKKFALYAGVASFYLLYAFLYAGWWFHESREQDVLRYEWNYYLFLILTGLIFFLPPVISLYIRSVGMKGFVFSAILTCIILFVVYSFSALLYYYTQEHRFDPFLQMPVPLLNDANGPKNDDAFRILALGGSTTLNARLPDKFRYPQKLESILQEQYPETPIEVFNAGMAFYTTRHSLITYATYYCDWEPDLVLIMHGINDLCRSFSPVRFAIGPYNDLWSHYYGSSIHGANPPTFEQHLLKTFFEEQVDGWYSDFRYREIDHPLDRYVSITPFEKNLRKIIHAARSDGAEVLLVKQPFFYKENMNDRELRALVFRIRYAASRSCFLKVEYPSCRSLNTAMNAFNDVVGNLAASEGAFIADAERRVPKNLNHFHDDVHVTAAGAHIIAETAAETIIESGVIE